MPAMSNVVFEEIQIGATASLQRSLTQTEIEVLALVSGDVDPFHIEGPGVSSPDAHTVEGNGAAALVAGVLGTKLPGPGMKILAEELRFAGSIAAGDTLTATVSVKEKRPAGAIVVLEGRCVNQRGEELVSGLITVAAPVERVSYKEFAPPQLELRRGDAFAGLFRACEGIQPVPCAVAHPCDRDALLGALEAAKRGILAPVLVGPEDKIRAVAEAAEVDLAPYRIVPADHSHAAAEKAVELARSGEVEALMKGSLHTDEFMAAIVPSAAGLRTSRRISHVFVMDVPTYPKILLVTDAAINIYPKLEEKVDIVQNAIALAHVLGVELPKVALLSAVETVTTRIESTLEAAALCKMADRRQITGALLDGPLAFDNAISEQAARTKGIVSLVAGQADILVVPDLEAGNMLAKQLSYLAGAEGAGIVLGTRVPVILTSRADSVRSRLASAAVAALVAQARRAGLWELR